MAISPVHARNNAWHKLSIQTPYLSFTEAMKYDVGAACSNHFVFISCFVYITQEQVQTVVRYRTGVCFQNTHDTSRVLEIGTAIARLFERWIFQN